MSVIEGHTCPFQTEAGPCGASVAIFNRENRILVCPHEHYTPFDQELPVPDRTPSAGIRFPRPRPRPQDLVLGALVIDAALRHL